MSASFQGDLEIKDISIITKLYALVNSYIIIGLVWEYADGTRRYLIGSVDPYKTNPIAFIERGCDAITNKTDCDYYKADGIKIRTISAPNGFDELQFVYFGDKTKEGGYALKEISLYKNSELLGNIKPQIDFDSANNHVKTLILPNGEVASGFSFGDYTYSTTRPIIYFESLYGNNDAVFGVKNPVPQPVKNPVPQPVADPVPQPANGGWSPWSRYGKCIKRGDKGYMFRSRKCTNPSPSLGGARCTGLWYYTEPCDLHEGRIDGGLSDWTQWSECIKIVDGVAVQQKDQQRTRSCNNPAPQSGGKNCSGEMIQKKSCDTAASTVVSVQAEQSNMWVLILIIFLAVLGGSATYYATRPVDKSVNKPVSQGGMVNTSCSQFVNYPTV